jgi:hypothetical protein
MLNKKIYLIIGIGTDIGKTFLLEKLAQKYDMTRIKNSASYNGAKLRITDIKRKDGEMISRKEMTKMCDGFLSELQNKYKDVDGIVSVSIKYPNRWYSADVSKLNSPINYFSLDQYEEMGEDPEYYEQIRFSFIPFKKSKEGGKDEHNDCLINCIRKYCPKKICNYLIDYFFFFIKRNYLMFCNRFFSRKLESALSIIIKNIK